MRKPGVRAGVAPLGEQIVVVLRPASVLARRAMSAGRRGDCFCVVVVRIGGVRAIVQLLCEWISSLLRRAAGRCSLVLAGDLNSDFDGEFAYDRGPYTPNPPNCNFHDFFKLYMVAGGGRPSARPLPQVPPWRWVGYPRGFPR